MKTALQELIEKLHPNFFTEEEEKIWLEKEKQQIIDAVIHGNRMEFYDANETAGEVYYNETYTTNNL